MPRTVSIRELGFNGDIIADLNEFGNYEWYDEKNQTHWEFNPETEESRHCGDGVGCFWTDWK